jgi:uncharacterized membrane protein YhaH (DUF805 family)
MNIVIIVLIILSIIIAVFGFIASANITGQNEQPIRSDTSATNAFLLAIFFLLLAIAIKIY